MLGTDALREAVSALRASSRPGHPSERDARGSAEEILAFVLGRTAGPGEELTGRQLHGFQRLVGRACSGIPAPYLTRRIRFMGLDLEVGPEAFIPRPWTELLAAKAIRRLRGRRAPVLVDLATGVGPVALSVARAVPEAVVFGVDIAPAPLAMARRSAARLGARNARFLRGDLYSPLPRAIAGRVSAITISPPHIPRGLMRSVLRQKSVLEPEEAFTDFSRTGLALLNRVAAEGGDWLAPGGWLLVEVMSGYSRSVAALLRRAEFADVRTAMGMVRFMRLLTARARH